MVGVESKKRKIAEKIADNDLKKYLRKNPAQIVIAPGGEIYLIDGHHTARALFENDVKEMRAEVVANHTDKSQAEFEKAMIQKKWVNLRDENGKPISFAELPREIKSLPNDPYRSLAWLLTKSGAFEKTDVPFAEFYWAEYLRERITIKPGRSGMEAAFSEALQIISEACPKLPGAKCLLTPGVCALNFKRLNLH